MDENNLPHKIAGYICEQKFINLNAKLIQIGVAWMEVWLA